ncbi:MAG: septal ring lytic transglycosylase RlpA family protein [Rubrivivax sp.]|nr:MAG: septal ring lytic transglycosylase RlpA family protein [Rubrivivax sp.]
MAGCASKPTMPRVPGIGIDRDGPLPNPPPDLAKVPDATPRLESIRNGGPNKPYEVLGERYQPMTADDPYADRGLASWYGRKFHGRPTASGEVYNMYAMTAAHATLPIPSYARVRNPANGKEVIVRINDRGPFHKGRIIDLSYTAALKLDVLRGVTPVEVRRITYAEIRSGQWPGSGNAPASEPAPVFVPDTPPGAPQRETTATVAGIGYWLQFGAFAGLDAAESLRQRVAEADLSLLPLLTIVREAGTHRLRAGPFPSADEARATADRLRGDGLPTTLIEKR